MLSLLTKETSYVKDILDKTPKSLEGVTIEPNGRWLLKAEEPEDNNFPSETFFDDEDEEVEISEISIIPARPTDKLPTPSTPTSSRQNGGGGTKRPAPAVIDLTLSSDDEDEEPTRRPFKRQSIAINCYQGPSSLSFPSLPSSPGLPPL